MLLDKRMYAGFKIFNKCMYKEKNTSIFLEYNFFSCF